MPKEVRTIYLVPKDRKVNHNYLKAIQNALTDLRSWYYHQTGGYTFTIHNPAVETKKSTNDAAWFTSNDPNPDRVKPIYNRRDWWFFNALKDAGAFFNDPDYVWVVYLDAPGGGGALNGCLCVTENDVLGLTGKNTVEKYVPRWTGGLGHELGHCFGLTHPKNGEHPNTIMQYGYRKYPNCYFPPHQISQLRKCAFLSYTIDPGLKYQEYTQERFTYGNGYYINTAKLKWEERNYNGAVYKFQETKREKDFVYLNEPARGFQVVLPNLASHQSNEGMSYIYLNMKWEKLGNVKLGTANDSAFKLERYSYPNGAFVGPQDKLWEEVMLNETDFNCFQETSRDANFIYLHDSFRNIKVALPKGDGKICLSVNNESWNNFNQVKKGW